MEPLSDNGKMLLSGVIAFEEKANEIIRLLADKFELDLKNPNPFSKLLTRRNNLWKGSFKNWNYRFHGDSCEFIEQITNQFLDIKINRKGNYGAIDQYFHWKFFSTTPSLKDLGHSFASAEVRFKTFQELELKGYIIDVGDEIQKTLVLNPELKK